MLITSTVNSSE